MEQVPTSDYLKRRLTPGLIRDCWELNEYRFTPEMVNDTHIVIDLGANFGAAAFCAACLSPDVRVLALEADLFNFGCLVKNILENFISSRIFPVHCAAHAVTGWKFLQSSLSGSHILNEPPTHAEWSSGVFGVPTRSLKAIFDDFEIDRCDVLKVDIEGSEFALFETADNATIARARQIAMEVHGTGQESGRSLVDAMIAKISQTHNVEWAGSNIHGGHLWATRK